MRLIASGWPSKLKRPGLVISAIGSALLLGALLAWGGPWRLTGATERGRLVYAQQCAACHGANLEGQAGWQTRKPDGRMPAPPHDGTGHTWHHTDDQLFRIVKNGIEAFAPGYQSDMPAYKDVLSDDEIRAVLAFIEASWPDSIRQRRQQMTGRTR